MVYIPRKMSNELIARFRVGCPILLRRVWCDRPTYTIIELGIKNESFPYESLGFVNDETIKVSKSDVDFLGETIYTIQDSKETVSRISWKISLETFEKVCKLLEKN